MGILRKNKNDEEEMYNQIKKSHKRKEMRDNDTYISPKKKRFLDYCDREADRLNKRR